ncbi:MAG: YhjD/YihY/BrkB family envelope integrity protein [Planctomycetota bacterium]
MENGPGDRKPAGKVSFLGLQLERVRRFLGRDVWDADLGAFPTFRAILYRLARVVYLSIRGLAKNNCMNQASSMTYITVLSLVPLLALGFSVAKGFGAYDHLLTNTIEPFLDSTFGPAVKGDALATGAGGPADVPAGDPATGESAGADQADMGTHPEAAGAASTELRGAVDKVLDFVSKTNFGNLGMLGLAFLFLTAVKLLTSIENVFNRIWGVKRSRSLVRKITDYVALVVITPVLLLAATAVTGAVRSNVIVEYMNSELHMGPVVTAAFKLLPLVAIWISFGFLYMAMPNTRVKFTSALIGGMVGGTLWQMVQIMHVEFQVGVARYNAIYSGFAAFPIFLVWLYMSWVTVLLGAQAAWAHQAEPEYRELMRDAPATGSDRETLAVHASVAIAQAFQRGRGPQSSDSLAARFAVPPRAIADVLSPLVDSGILAQTGRDVVVAYTPARPLSAVRIQTILEAVRGGREEHDGPPTAIDRVLEDLRQDLITSDHNLPLDQLIDVEPDKA